MNRALEFLELALDAYPLLRDRHMWKMKHYVELAKEEVRELLHENYQLRQHLAPQPDFQNDRVVLLTGINGGIVAVDGRRQTVDGVVRTLENVR